MLDTLICLFTLIVGAPFVVAMFWRSYGLDARWAAFTSSGDRSAHSDTRVRRPDMDALKPLSEPVVFDGSEPDANQFVEAFDTLPRADKLVVLAALRDGDDWLLSANALVKAFGGDRSEVLAAIREVRQEPAEPAGRTLNVRDIHGARKIAF